MPFRKLQMVWVSGQRVSWQWPLREVWPRWAKWKFEAMYPGVHVLWKTKPYSNEGRSVLRFRWVDGVKLDFNRERPPQFTYGRDKDY